MEEKNRSNIKEERYTMPVSVQVMMIKENKILMTKRANTGYEDGKYCLPGGHVEKLEEIKQAMIREAKEEVGVTIKREDLQLYKVLNRKTEDGGAYIDFIFKTEKWEGQIQNIEKDKCDEIAWIDRDDIPCNILPYIVEMLKDEKELYMPYDW